MAMLLCYDRPCWIARQIRERKLDRTLQQTVTIRPDVGILGVLRYLNYTPWYALAEFVDNSLQSYLTHRDDLVEAKGSDQPLVVEIEG